jgi:hypothetical protein
MSTTAANQARAAALKAARAKDSEHKRRRALAALEALEATAASITFTGWPKPPGCPPGWSTPKESANTSTPLDVARPHRSAAPALTPSGKHTTTSASLRTDLAIARDQIKTLRAERDKLQQRLRLHLGAEIEGPDRAHLTARVGDLEAVNRRLVAERDARAIEADTANRRVAELEGELSAARESLRRVIKSHNRPQ